MHYTRTTVIIAVMAMVMGCAGGLSHSKKSLPDWYLNTPEEELALYGIGEPEGQDLGLTRQAAEASTRDENTTGVWDVSDGSGTIVNDITGNGNDVTISRVSWSTDVPYIDSFTKITNGVLVTEINSSVGSSWADYDNDGNLDLLVLNNGTNNLYRNEGGGSFVEIGPPLITDIGAGSSSWADYDNDGDLDLLITGLGNNHLYSNNGDGTFSEVIEDSVVTDGGTSYAGAWGDIDNDGDVDLFIANIWETNFLYMNNGDGTFTKVTDSPVVNDVGQSLSASWADYDSDGDIDLFVCNQGGENDFLYTNDGDGAFTKVTSGPVVTGGGGSRGNEWGDYDNDGDLDLFVADYHSTNILYTNNGDGTFTKVTDGPVVTDSNGNETHGCGWGDVDNDGDLDLFAASRDGEYSLFYWNNGDGTFTKDTTSIVSHEILESIGVTLADYDRDGDLDLYFTNGPDLANTLYQNKGSSNNWMNIKLEGVVSNRSAIGAVIKVKAAVDGAQSQWLMRHISAQTGYLSQNSLDAEFGLGIANIIDSIQVEWPSGIKQTLTNVAVNQFLEITEGIEVANVSWAVQIRASASSGNDNDNHLGVAPDATNGFDAALDEVEPPAPPGSSISLYFPHPEWGNQLGDNFTQDIKPEIVLTDTMQVWDFEVKSTDAGSTTLDFLFSSVPSVPVILENKATGERQTLTNGGTYSFAAIADSAHPFQISIGDTTPPSLALDASCSGPRILLTDSIQVIGWNTTDGYLVDSVEVGQVLKVL